MRLTLRTLLAWRDAVLPPDEQKTLGEKVAASPVAGPLIARLREVVQRPLLAAPRLDGRGLADDANSVAEYLDNALAADKLEPFERVCIESDVHLAEVSACHGLLAELAHEPTTAAALAAGDRRHLLALIRERAPDVAQASVHPGAIAAGSRGVAEAAAAAATGPLVASGKTALRPRAPLAAWLLASAAVALLVALVGLLFYSLGRQRGRQQVAQVTPEIPRPAEAVAQPPAPAVVGRVDEKPAAADPTLPAASPPPEPAAAAAAVAGPQAAVATAAQVVEPPAGERPAEPAPAVAALPPMPAAIQPRVPQGDALAIAAPVERPAVTAPAPPPAAADDGAGFVGGGDLLLRLAVANPPVHGQSGWAAATADSPLRPREDLIAPPLCRPEVHVAGVTIRLEPNTRAVITRDVDGSPRLELVFGRAVLRSSVAQPRLGIAAGGLVGAITEGMRDPVGVEVAFERAAGADPAKTPARVRSFIATTNSGIVWTQAEAAGAEVRPARGVLERGSWLAWDSLDPAAIGVMARRPPPEWLVGPPRSERLDAEAAKALAAKAAADPLERGLRELADDRRVENRIAAVATLALLGDYDELVAALAAESPPRRLEERQWTRLFDMTVPLALARGANAAARLGQAFESRGPDGTGPEAFALACGFDDAALAAGGAERLVTALDAPELMLRRMAFRGLTEIVEPAEADRFRYRPDRPKDLRRDGVSWWRRQFEEGRIRRPVAGAANR